jgi:phospholipid/cholesterol/gamma-HCH transport system ATP-binding protein
MAGLFVPKEGQVLVEGEDWQRLESEEKHQLAAKIGMLFQKSALFDSLTAFENVAFPLREHTELGEAEIEEKVMHYLTEVGLKDDRFKYPHELSGGMQRRLGIARALALNPEILFYDDPTAGQDPITSDKIAKLLLELKARNSSTVVAVTNDMLRAYQMADRIFLVAEGEVIDIGSVEETKASKDLRVQQFIHGRLQGPLTHHDKKIDPSP